MLSPKGSKPTPPGIPIAYPNGGMSQAQMFSPAPFAQNTAPMCVAPGSLHPTWQSGAGFSYNVQQPQSCGSERTKVANLRKLIESHEAKIIEIEKFKDKQDFVNGAMLVTAVVLETSIGFLDLAAAMLGSINPKAAAAAETGLFAIEAAGKTSEAAHGQRSWASAAGHIADKGVDTAVSVSKPDTIAGKALLSSAKLKYDAAVITIKASFGADTATIKNDSFDMVKDRSKSLAEMVGDGLSDADYKAAGKTIEGLVVVAEMYEAGTKYHNALDQRMNDYFDHKEWVASYVADEKIRLLRTINGFKQDLKKAVAELEACELKA